MAAALKMLVWDVDGTIADTERYGHLPAANEAMAQLGLDIEWSWAEFRRMIGTIPGNANRLRHALTERGMGARDIEEYVKRFEPLKRELYINKYLYRVKLRAGVRALVEQVVKSGLRLAIISTSYESQIEALLQALLAEFREHFEYVLGKEHGSKTRSNGLLHRMLLERTALLPKELMMIEDAADGLEAAVTAQIPTLVCYNDYTKGHDFRTALAVVPTLESMTLDQLFTFHQTTQQL